MYALMLFANVGLQAQQLSPDEFEKKLKASKDYNLLDVRTKNEFDQGNMANSVLLDFYRSDFREQVSKLDRNKPVFVYCAVGGRSNAAVGVFNSLGFKQVYDLQGGIRAWSQAGKPVSK